LGPRLNPFGTFSIYDICLLRRGIFVNHRVGDYFVGETGVTDTSGYKENEGLFSDK
jgi:hypothetical protein